MRFAVTGATGFVGSHLAEELRLRGHEVAVLARSRAKAARLETLGCRVIPGDLGAAGALEDLVRGADVAVHVAGAVAARNESELLRVNRDGARAVSRAAAASGVARFVHVSSLAVTGPTVPGRPLDESGPPRPVTPYGRSKLAGEEAVRETGVPFAIVRPPAVYGPRDRELFRVFRMARAGVVPLLGDGDQELSLVHAADLAGALIAVATAPGTLGRVYHAAHPDTLTQRGLVEAVARAVGRRVRTVAIPAPLVRAALGLSGFWAGLTRRTTLLTRDKVPELLAPAWIASSEALERDAGWRARLGHEEGFAQTARWYREAGWL